MLIYDVWQRELIARGVSVKDRKLSLDICSPSAECTKTKTNRKERRRHPAPQDGSDAAIEHLDALSPDGKCPACVGDILLVSRSGGGPFICLSRSNTNTARSDRALN